MSSDSPSLLTDDVEFDGVVDGGGLAEVDPAHEGARVEPLHPRHAQRRDGRRGRPGMGGGGGSEAEVGALPERRRLRPEVGPPAAVR